MSPQPPPLQEITITVAPSTAATDLARIMTSAFSQSDAAYPLIWGRNRDFVHSQISTFGLFTPLQKPDSITYIASAPSPSSPSQTQILGFATWILPHPPASTSELPKDEGLPEIEGVNMALWNEKVSVSAPLKARDVDEARDMRLSLFFVDPQFQGRGVGRRLLEKGKEMADERGAKIWLTATPQAVGVYEKCGWRVVERIGIDLGKWGGEGVYERAWMVRIPRGVGR